MRKRLFPLLTAAVLLLSLVSPAALAVEESSDVIYITSVSDLMNLAENCTLDTWSQGKTVRLSTDLVLTGCGFIPIPTFGGVFDGGHFTISGLEVHANGSNQGLFRYIQPGGVVKNLTVKGTVAPGGSASSVGGIAGTNRGTISACVFSGAVQGRSNIGGVCGVNESGGRVVSCSVSGTVQGEQATGGVCGKNAGTLLSCTSRTRVNISPNSDDSLNMAALADGSALDSLTTVSDQSGERSLSGWQDVGGIAGYSSGVVQSCVNSGSVGYPHMGYNIGGIAGRQAGYLSGCSNTGHIQGRKDVGGIAGQCEPYIVMGADSDTLEKLRSALNRLSALIDIALNDADSTSDHISAKLTALGDSADSARDSSKDLIDRTADLLNANVDTLNDLSVAVTNALDKLSPAMDDLSDASDDLATLAARLEPALDALVQAGDIGEAAARQLSAAMSDLKTAAQQGKSASDKIKLAAQNLRQAVVIDDQAAVNQALADLGAGLGEMSAALSAAAKAMSSLADALGQTPQDLTAAAAAFAQLSVALNDLSSANGKIAVAVAAIQTNTHIDAAKVNAALEQISSAANDLSAASAALESGFEHLHSASNAAGNLSAKLRDAFEKLKPVASAGESAGRKLSNAFDKLKASVEELRKAGDVTFTPVDDDFRAAGDKLYDDLAAVSRGMEELNSTVTSASDLLLKDLRAVNSQFSTVMNLMLDAMDDLRSGLNGDKTLSDHIEDVSAENIAATTLGKTADSTNTGLVEADRNVGGIVGEIGIEYDLDPEDDSSLDISYTATYQSKAVVTGCVNRGNITGKKDCVGGVVGRMDLGLVTACQNYGDAESTGGGYVGGVAGTASSIVRACYAKCTLSGGDYVGGVAGSGKALTDCVSIVTLTAGKEYLGAVAGYAEDLDRLSGNLFLDTGVGGVDSISYSGHAEPASYDRLRALPSIPTELVSFTLTLTADGETVASIPFLYGADLSLVELPEVPAKEDCFGVWPEFNYDGVHSDVMLEAVYTPWITVLATDAASEGLSLALAEGRFTDQAALESVPQTDISAPVEGAAVFRLSLTGTDLTEDSVTPLRILCPGGGTLWHYGAEGWTQVITHRSGSYLLTEMHGVSGVFCAVPSDSLLTAILSACGILTALVVLAVILLRRKRKKRLNSGANASVLKNNPSEKASATVSRQASVNEIGKSETRNEKEE